MLSPVIDKIITSMKGLLTLLDAYIGITDVDAVPSDDIPFYTIDALPIIKSKCDKYIDETVYLIDKLKRLLEHVFAGDALTRDAQDLESEKASLEQLVEVTIAQLEGRTE